MSEELARLRKEAERDPAKRVRLVDMLVAHGQTEDAIKQCQRFIAGAPKDVGLKLALGRALSAQGRLKEAQAIFQAVAESEGEITGTEAFEEAPTNLVQPSQAAVLRGLVRPTLPPVPLTPEHAELNSLADEISEPRLGSGATAAEASTRIERHREPSQPEIAPATRATRDLNAVAPRETVDQRLERLAQLVHQVSGYVPHTAVLKPSAFDVAIVNNRKRSFAWLWGGFVLFVIATAGGYHYRTLVRRAKLAEGVAAATASAQAGTFAGDRAARETLAALLRAMPDEATLFADVAQANARLAADHGEDTDDAGWAMLRRAEKTLTEHKAVATDATALTLKQTRALLALYRPEPCPDDILGVTVDIVARCQQLAGHGQEAKAALTNAAATDTRAQLQLAVTYYGEGDTAGAQRTLEHVLQLSPDNMKAKLLAWIIRIERGDNDDFGALPPSGLSRDEEGWLFLGRALLANRSGGNVDEALEQVQARMQHDGRLALALGRVRLSRGQLAQAEQAMRLASSIEPNDPDVAVLDASVALAKGYEQKVATALASTQNSPRQQVVFGKALFLAGKPKEALVALQRALQKRPGDEVALTYRALARVQSGDVAGGEREIGTLKKNTVLTHYALGTLAYGRRDYKRAVDELARVTENNDEAFRARAMKGLAEVQTGDLAKAIDDLEAVRKVAPEFAGVHTTLGRVYLSLGRDREARAVLAFLIEDPRGLASDADRFRYTEATTRRGLITEATPLIDALPASIAPPERDRLRALVQSFRGGKDALLAAARLEKLRKTPGDHARLEVDITDAYRRGGDLKRATLAARTAVLAQPFWGQVALGRVLGASNDPAGAEAADHAALVAIALRPYGAEAATLVHIALSQIALAHGDHAAAVNELKAALVDDPHSPDALFALGHAYNAMGDREKAVDAFDRTTLEDDTFADAWLALADTSRDLAIKSTPAAALKLRASARRAYEHYLTLEPSATQAKAAKRSLYALPK